MFKAKGLGLWFSVYSLGFTCYCLLFEAHGLMLYLLPCVLTSISKTLIPTLFGFNP